MSAKSIALDADLNTIRVGSNVVFHPQTEHNPLPIPKGTIGYVQGRSRGDAVLVRFGASYSMVIGDILEDILNVI